MRNEGRVTDLDYLSFINNEQKADKAGDEKKSIQGKPILAAIVAACFALSFQRAILGLGLDGFWISHVIGNVPLAPRLSVDIKMNADRSRY